MTRKEFITNVTSRRRTFRVSTHSGWLHPDMLLMSHYIQRIGLPSWTLGALASPSFFLFLLLLLLPNWTWLIKLGCGWLMFDERSSSVVWFATGRASVRLPLHPSDHDIFSKGKGIKLAAWLFGARPTHPGCSPAPWTDLDAALELL